MSITLDGTTLTVLLTFLAVGTAGLVVAVAVLVDWYVRKGANGKPPRIAWRRWLTVGPAVAVALYFLWSVRAIVTPFLVAFFLAALLDPVVVRIEQHGWIRRLFLWRMRPLHRRGDADDAQAAVRPREVGRSRAVSILFGTIVATLVLAGLLVIPAVMGQVSQFAGGLGDDIAKFTHSAQGWAKGVDELYGANKQSFAAVGITDKPSKLLSDKSGPLAAAGASILGTVKVTALAMMGQVLWLIIIPLSLLYFLLEYPAIRAKLISFVPNEHRAEVNRMSGEIVEIFATYILGLAKVCVLYGVAVTVFLLLFRVKYSLFLGIGAGVLYAVPYVGPIIAIGSVGITAFVGSESAGITALVIVGMVFLQFSFDYVITPRVVGGSVGLHPLVNIFALMCGASLFGLWGMLLAVPVAASIQMLLFYFIPAIGERPAADRPAQHIPPAS